eukprot:Rmarinus@m.9794
MLVLLLLCILPALCADEQNLCHEHAEYSDMYDACTCHPNFFGDGSEVCQPCGMNMVSSGGSKSADDCVCIDHYVKSSEADECIPICSDEEVSHFATHNVDTGLLAAAGCDLNLDASLLPRSCCEAVNATLGHPCYLPSLEIYGVSESGNQPPHISLYNYVAEACGIVAGKGFVLDGCGNGIQSGWERCDDGNNVTSDGCSDCWVDTGFSCGTMTNGTSDCRTCAEDCTAARRAVCVAEGGPCGECISGYGEYWGDSDDSHVGQCAKLLQVFYAAVDSGGWEEGSQHSCKYEQVGEIFETRQYPSAAPYISHLNAFKPNRTRPGTSGNCTLNSAFAFAPDGLHVALLIELFDEVVLESIEVGSNKNAPLVVVFSENEQPAAMSHVEVANMNFFTILAGSTLIIHNVLVTGGQGVEGAFVRDYGGVVILENSSISNFQSPPLGSFDDIVWLCDGFVIFSVSALVLRDVTFSDILISEVDDKCLSLYYDAVATGGYLHIDGLHISRSSVRGNFFLRCLGRGLGGDVR